MKRSPNQFLWKPSRRQVLTGAATVVFTAKVEAGGLILATGPGAGCAGGIIDLSQSCNSFFIAAIL